MAVTGIEATIMPTRLVQDNVAGRRVGGHSFAVTGETTNGIRIPPLLSKIGLRSRLLYK